MTEAIPNDVKDFLLKYIDSIAQWEALLLLRTESAKEWDVGAVAENLYITEKNAQQMLSQLAARRMLVRTPDSRYRYEPQNAELDRMIERTAKLYRQQLIPVTQIIHSKARSRVQEFADAFRLRKD